MIYTFNNIELDTEKFQLLNNGVEESVEPQVFNLIVFLVQNKEKVLSRDQILEHVWKDRVVSDSSISNHIKSARKVLGDDGIKQQVIKTIHSRGYQFIATCETITKPKIDSTILTKKVSITKNFLVPIVLLIITTGIVWIANFQSNLIPKDGVPDKSIAVLAFKDLSQDGNQNYFAEGISEELLNLFTRIPDLHVSSRTSSFSYKNKNMKLEDIGKELNVRYVMEGSVRKSKEKLRITAQLIRVNDGSHVWSETYDHDIQDVFKIQDEIAKAVSDKLEVSLTNDRVKLQIENPEAIAICSQALYYYNQNNISDLIKSLDLINQSIALEPNSVESWTLKSRIHYKMMQSPFKGVELESIKLTKESIVKARLIDNKYATANAQMALINLLDLDFEAARFNIDLAMSRKNQSTETTEIIAEYYQLTGQIQKSVEILEDAIEQDPINDTYYYNLAIGYFHLDQLRNANKFMNKYHFFHEEAHVFKGIFSQLYVAGEKNDKALEYAKEEPNEFYYLFSMGMVSYALEDYQKADEILNEVLTKYSGSPVYVASLYAFRDDYDNAFKWLDVAFENLDSEILYLINFHSFRNLMDDPRWGLFITKMNLPKNHWLNNKKA